MPLAGTHPAVIEVQRRVRTTPDQVWAVLADGWNYVSWVVRTPRMRAVDEHWPAQGATLHHSAGLWPALLNDQTHVLRVAPGPLRQLLIVPPNRETLRRLAYLAERRTSPEGSRAGSVSRSQH
jgi:hypothetical protein